MGNQNGSPEVSRLVENTVRSPDPNQYRSALDFLAQATAKPDTPSIQAAIASIKSVIKSPKFSNKDKYRALHLFKDMMKTGRKDVTSYANEKILKRLFALANSNHKERVLVVNHPGSNPQDSKDFYHLLLECFAKWKINIPPPNTQIKAYATQLENKGLGKTVFEHYDLPLGGLIGPGGVEDPMIPGGPGNFMIPGGPGAFMIPEGQGNPMFEMGQLRQQREQLLAQLTNPYVPVEDIRQRALQYEETLKDFANRYGGAGLGPAIQQDFQREINFSEELNRSFRELDESVQSQRRFFERLRINCQTNLGLQIDPQLMDLRLASIRSGVPRSPSPIPSMSPSPHHSMSPTPSPSMPPSVFPTQTPATDIRVMSTGLESLGPGERIFGVPDMPILPPGLQSPPGEKIPMPSIDNLPPAAQFPSRGFGAGMSQDDRGRAGGGNWAGESSEFVEIPVRREREEEIDFAETPFHPVSYASQPDFGKAVGQKPYTFAETNAPVKTSVGDFKVSEFQSEKKKSDGSEGSFRAVSGPHNSTAPRQESSIRPPSSQPRDWDARSPRKEQLLQEHRLLRIQVEELAQKERQLMRQLELARPSRSPRNSFSSNALPSLVRAKEHQIENMKDRREELRNFAMKENINNEYGTDHISSRYSPRLKSPSWSTSRNAGAFSKPFRALHTDSGTNFVDEMLTEISNNLVTDKRRY